jgi:hypothetical protein
VLDCSLVAAFACAGKPFDRAGRCQCGIRSCAPMARLAVLKLVELLDLMARLVSSGSSLRLGDPLFSKDPVGSLVESFDLMTKLVEQ